MTDEEIKYIRNRTSKEIRQTILQDCQYCKYSEGGYRDEKICNYIGITGKIRPCLPGKCRQAGVWKEKRKTRKRKRLKLNLGRTK